MATGGVIIIQCYVKQARLHLEVAIDVYIGQSQNQFRLTSMAKDSALVWWIGVKYKER